MSSYILPQNAINLANNIRSQYGLPPYVGHHKFLRPLTKQIKDGQTFYNEEEVKERAHQCAKFTARLQSYKRLYKKGDRVRVIEWHGRRYSDYDHGTELKTGELCEVCEDEANDDEGFVSVTYQGQIRSIAPCFLEMVTPRELLSRYYIKSESSGYAVMDRDSLGFVAYFSKPQHPLAKEAAQLECSRLNAMHKEMQQ